MNCTGYVLGQSLLPHLKTRTEAAIINIGSTLASVAYPGYVTYCASKFGLRGATEALRRELYGSNIQIFYCAPRTTDTEMPTDAERQFNTTLGNSIDSPDIVAKTICKQLQQGKPNNLYIGRKECFATKFNALFPAIVDKAIYKQRCVWGKLIKS